MNLNDLLFLYGQREWNEWFALKQKSSPDALLEFQEAEEFRKEKVDGGKEGRRWVSTGSPAAGIHYSGG
jgi:hypothetical protein